MDDMYRILEVVDTAANALEVRAASAFHAANADIAA